MDSKKPQCTDTALTAYISRIGQDLSSVSDTIDVGIFFCFFFIDVGVCAAVVIVDVEVMMLNAF